MIWFWIGLWAVLLAGAAVVLFLLGRSAWRAAVRLGTEVAEASDRLAEVTARLDEAAERSEPLRLAVFADPAELRRADRARRRGSVRTGGRHRAADRRPSALPGATT